MNSALQTVCPHSLVAPSSDPCLFQVEAAEDQEIGLLGSRFSHSFGPKYFYPIYKTTFPFLLVLVDFSCSLHNVTNNALKTYIFLALSKLLLFDGLQKGLVLWCCVVQMLLRQATEAYTVVNKRDPVSSKLEGKDYHSRLSSDLHNTPWHVHVCIHIHKKMHPHAVCV